MRYSILLTHDEAAQVWIAESEDIPGLVLEAGSMEALLEKLRFAVPEILALNATE